MISGRISDCVLKCMLHVFLKGAFTEANELQTLTVCSVKNVKVSIKTSLKTDFFSKE